MSAADVGLVLFAAGFGLRFWGLRYLVRHAGFTVRGLQSVAVPPRGYLKYGPFRLRHPLYIGGLLMMAGAGMLCLGWGGAILAYAVVPFYRDRIFQEAALRRESVSS